MKKIMPLLALSLLSITAFADNWQPLGNTSDPANADIYVDKSRIVRHGSTVTFWRRFVYENLQPSSDGKPLIKATDAQQSVSCANHTYINLAMRAYADDGKVVGDLVLQENDRQPQIIPPDSNIASLSQYVCAYNPAMERRLDMNARKAAQITFATINNSGMTGAEKLVRHCYVDFFHHKSVDKMQVCIAEDISSRFMVEAAMKNGLPEWDYFKKNALFSRLSDAYMVLGYSRIKMTTETASLKQSSGKWLNRTITEKMNRK